MKTQIKNAVILTMDHHRVIRNGSILIDGGKIAKITEGTFEDEDAEVIDAKGNVVMPGLINAHTHSPMTLLRSYADGYTLEKWLNDYIFPVEDNMNAEDFYLGAQLAICEMLSTGTTCFADMYFGMDSIVKAVTESRIKANLSRCVTCFDDSITDFSHDVRVGEALSLYQEWHNAQGGRIKVDFSLHSVYLATPNCISAVAGEAKDRNAVLHIHASETLTENKDCIKRYGKTPIAHLHGQGAIYDKTMLAHCVYLTEEDIEILAESGATAIHNPTSNLKLASGISPTHKLLSAGVNVALGTDGASSNNNLNMFEEVHLAALLPKGASLDPEVVDAYAALQMATVNGAAACGRQGECGMLKVGYDADLIMIDTSKPHLVPMHNPTNNMVYSAQGSDVVMTMVGGEILYRNGEFTTLDYEKIRYGIGQSVKRLF